MSVAVRNLAILCLAVCSLAGGSAACGQKTAAGRQTPARQKAAARNTAAVAAGSPERTRQVLIANARALESRGRPDMAVQIWQQVLLSEPKNPEALAGLARCYKLSGDTKNADAALEKLRSANPNDANIGKIESLTSTRTQSDQLRKAGDLARQGKSEDAMHIYRDLYGDRPPDGDIALAYYQTMYGTTSGKPQAIASMRALAARNPGDPRYVVELGRMLTYDARTRPEGIRILEQHPQDPDGRAALRQALVWDSANPASAAELRNYLKAHPLDKELSSRLKENEQKLAVMNSGIARTADEKAAFAALNAHRLEEAQQRFVLLLEKDPNNGRVDAGMGFLRMQQGNFGGAISYFTQAQQNGYKAASVQNALATSRYWYTMGEASQAFDGGQLDVAAAKYKDALAMRPKSAEALNGLAGLYVKEQQFPQAEAIYEQLLKLQPRNNDAWRGLFLAYARDGQAQKALATANRFPAPVKSAMGQDPDYLRTLASIYQAQGRSGDAQKVLSQALALPFPEDGAKLKQDTRLQYAAILMEANRFSQAAALYGQVLNDDPSNLNAWMGLVSAHHQAGQDTQAMGDVEKMPPAAYESALNDPGFLSMLGSMYQQNNQLEVAQNLLERSAKMQATTDGQPSVQIQLQLAAIYLQRNNTAQAYALYRQVLTAHPDRQDAWKGLIATLQTTGHVNEALQQLSYIPATVKAQLEADPQFVESEASLYAAAGDTPHAMQYLQRVQQHYAKSGGVMPADLVIQNAWLLYNTQNDRGLYPALMNVGNRQDLTFKQREVIQTIWANWAVRRAGAAMDNDENERAVEILEAASNAFPDNVEVRRILAGGYLRTGRSREALAIFKQIPMQNASAADYQGAIGSALGANDKTQAEIFLRQALDRFPNDYHILGLAARFEQARGDNHRAADFWRAAIAAMPQGSPTDRLAHDLAYRDVNTKAHKVRTAGELAQLLDPNYGDATAKFPKMVTLPPLPAYGPDPYLGRAPVILGNEPRANVAQLPAEATAPATTTIYEPIAPDVQRLARKQSAAPASERVPVSQSATPPTSTGFSTDTGSASRSQQNGSRQDVTPQGTRKSVHRRHPRATSGDTGTAPGYEGRMDLPPSEESVTTTAGGEHKGTAGQGSGGQAPVWVPTPQTVQPGQNLPWNPPVIDESSSPRLTTTPTQPALTPADPAQENPAQPQNDLINPAPAVPVPSTHPQKGVPPSMIPPQASGKQPGGGLRLSSQPMDEKAAAVQTLFADQTDAQVSQDGSGQIRTLQNVPVVPPSHVEGEVKRTLVSERTPNFNDVQYTPSAQEAATGAYSSQRQQSQNPTAEQNPTQQNTQQPKPALKRQRQAGLQQQTSPQTPGQAAAPAPAPQLGNGQGATAPRRPRAATRKQKVPTLVTAPNEQQQQATGSFDQAEPESAAQQPVGDGATDEELQQQNLPPLRGPWIKVKRQPQVVSPRDEAEAQLLSLESGYSAWIAGTGLLNYRSGDLGYDRLAALEAPFEVSTPLGYHMRFTFLAKPVFLDSGQADGTSIIQVQEATTSGRSLVTIPQPLGTATNTGPVAGSTTTSVIPPQQNASGLAGEVQLSFPNLALAAGITPYGFLVRNWTARALWRPANGAFTFSFQRDSVKDTQLSYAGLRNPGDASLSYPGSVWGGVMASQGNVQYARGDALSGFYFGAGGQYLTGYKVQTNTRYDGTGGAYWRIKSFPEYGNLSIGVNFFGMHYQHNQQAFTYGMGGYFSPQAYFLANVPFTFVGHYNTRFHYEVLGGLGVQAFQQDLTPLFPLPAQNASEVGLNNAALPAMTSVGANYSVRGTGAYQITPHWFAGGFLSANNSRNYQSASVGFSIHYMFRAQPATVTTPTGIFPTDGLRPFTVP